MRKLVRESILFEEFLGTIEPYENTVGIYKNPPSIKRMGKFIRAITDIDGNFYVSDHYDCTHDSLIFWLSEMGELKEEDPWNYTNGSAYTNLVAWQRGSKTNKFYLAESYKLLELKDIEGEEKMDQWIIENIVPYFNDKYNKVEFILKPIEENEHFLK